MIPTFKTKYQAYLDMLIRQNHDWLEQDNDWEDEDGKAERVKERNENRLVVLADAFGIRTSEDYYSSKMAGIIVKAIAIINDKAWGEMDHEEFLYAINTGFFKDKLEWGVSAQMPWWDYKPMGDSLFFTHGKTLQPDEWKEYMRAVVAFAKGESK